MKTSCCHTNVRVKMKVKLIWGAIQQCWHSCTWKKKSYGINYNILVTVSYRKDITRTESDSLIFFSLHTWESNILLCSALFSREVAGEVWLQAITIRVYASTIKQDPIMFRGNLIDLDRRKEMWREKKNHINKGSDYDDKLNCHLPVCPYFYKTCSTEQSPDFFLCVCHTFFPQ